MSSHITDLASEAKQKAIYIRTESGLGLKNPICVFDLCNKLELSLRFVDINMEGIYLREVSPKILVSSLRPLARKRFTCAHELGHHIFGHGSTLDQLIEEWQGRTTFKPEEFIANSFAGFLLMPALGIRKAFSCRKWSIDKISAEQVYTVACNFGVGYETLVNHMRYSLKMISSTQKHELSKVKPKQIRENVLGFSTISPLVIADSQWLMTTIDIEVGYDILLPYGTRIDGKSLVFSRSHPKGYLFKASRVGIVRAYLETSEWAVFVRVAKRQFIGLSQYRHLEDIKENE